MITFTITIEYLKPAESPDGFSGLKVGAATEGSKVTAQEVQFADALKGRLDAALTATAQEIAKQKQTRVVDLLARKN